MKKTILIETAKGNVSVPDRLKYLDKTERHAVLATVFQESRTPRLSLLKQNAVCMLVNFRWFLNGE